MKLISGEKEKNIIILLGIIVICVILYFLAYKPFVAKIVTLEENKKVMQIDLLDKKNKVNNIAETTAKIEKIKLEMGDLARTFYGNALQEKFIYLLDNFEKESGLEIPNISFNRTKIKKSSELFDIMETSTGGQEVKNEYNDLDVVILSAELGTEGTFENYQNFLELVDNNKERIVIERINLSKNDEPNPTDYPDIAPEEVEEEVENEAILPSFLGGGDTEGAITSVESGIIEGTITLNFYLIPAVDTYKTEEELKDDDLYNPSNTEGKENPFDHSQLFDEKLTRESIFKFEGTDYKPMLENTTLGGEVMLVSKEDGMYPELSYEFTKNESNARAILDLSDKNIILPEGSLQIGAKIYSKNVTTGKVILVVVDSTGQTHNIQIADRIYWGGGDVVSNIASNINQDIPGPIKLKEIFIQQDMVNNNNEAKGALTFAEIYIGKR